MSSIKELKELVGQVNFTKLKSLLAPYKELAGYVIQIEDLVNSLEQSKPKPRATRRRSATKETE